jgi:hypothetical protein
VQFISGACALPKGQAGDYFNIPPSFSDFPRFSRFSSDGVEVLFLLNFMNQQSIG